MKCIAGSMVFLAILTGSAEARDMLREVAGVEQAPAGKPYDYIVHVRNVPAIGYNPLVKAGGKNRWRRQGHHRNLGNNEQLPRLYRAGKVPKFLARPRINNGTGDALCSRKVLQSEERQNLIGSFDRPSLSGEKRT
jgi:hypothetical protein